MKLKPKEERKEIDLAIREAIGKRSSDKCNDVWKEVKIWLNNEDKKLKLKNTLKKFNAISKDD